MKLNSLVWFIVGALFMVLGYLCFVTYGIDTAVMVTTVKPVTITYRFVTDRNELVDFIAAIQEVETGGERLGGTATVTTDANGLEFIGPLQIGYACWVDARMPTGDWRDCLNRGYAEEVATAYWRRYCYDAWASCDFETLAKVWRGGPNGASKRWTHSYWLKVRRVLES